MPGCRLSVLDKCRRTRASGNGSVRDPQGQLRLAQAGGGGGEHGGAGLFAGSQDGECLAVPGVTAGLFEAVDVVWVAVADGDEVGRTANVERDLYRGVGVDPAVVVD